MSTRRVFATLDDFLPPDAAPQQVGRNMANHYFLRALLRHGTFDEYHFFLCNEAHVQWFLRAQSPMLDELGARDKVRTFSRLALLENVRRVDYTAFHLSDHVTSFDALCRVRNRLGATFPVSGFIHSVSYGEFMPAYLSMLHGGVTQNDIILCSSRTGERAVRRSFERLERGLALSPLPVRFEVVPLGIDDTSSPRSSLPRSVRREQARSALNLPQDAVVCLCFGRFSEVDKMDHLPLVQAFAGLGNMPRTTVLVLAGAVQSDSYVRVVELWARAMGVAQRVRLEKNVNEAHKSLLYEAADIFVSVPDNPQETFGLTLLEALRAGLPLVVSDYDGYRDIATEDVALRVPTIWQRPGELELVEPILDPRSFHLLLAQCLSVDVPSLSSALRELCLDGDKRERMALAAAQKFDEHYRHDRIIARLEAIWDERKANFVACATKEDPLSLSVFDTFDHYPTRFLSAEDMLRIAPLGHKLRDTGANHPLLSGMAEVIDSGVVADLLRNLESERSAAELTASVSHLGWKASYTLAWMLKHGLVELAS